MNKILILLAFLFAVSAAAQQEARMTVDSLLTAWHRAASEADFEGYFGAMADGAVFIGTDASENWDKNAFMTFSKPFFDRGRAWSFTAVERNIFLSPDGKTAWFDELLDTWMQLCRGSGVAVRTDSGWKIAHYVLSLTMPNDAVQEAIALKREPDSLLRIRLEKP